MKNLITSLLLVFMAFSASAQSLVFQLGEQEIANGSTVYYSENEEIPFLFGILQFNPKIYLKGDASKTVYASIEAIEGENLERWGLCAYNNPQTGCVNTLASTDYAVTKWGLLTDGCLDQKIDFILSSFDSSKTLLEKARVSAWYEGEESEKISFTLVVTTDKTLSVSGVTAANAVTISGRTLDYAFGNAAVRTLSVYTVGGAKVMSQVLDGAKGSVSLDVLAAGIYVYRVSGTVPVEGKFIVK